MYCWVFIIELLLNLYRSLTHPLHNFLDWLPKLQLNVLYCYHSNLSIAKYEKQPVFIRIVICNKVIIVIIICTKHIAHKPEEYDKCLYIKISVDVKLDLFNAAAAQHLTRGETPSLFPMQPSSHSAPEPPETDLPPCILTCRPHGQCRGIACESPHQQT